MNQPMLPSLEHRRRAVYTALIEHLDGDALWEALVRWEDAYAGDPAFSAHRFLSEVLDTPALKSQRVRVHQSLVKAQAAPLSALLPDPREQLLAWRARQGRVVSLAANSRDPVVAACASLVARLLQRIDETNRLRMRLWLLEQVDRSKLPDAVRQAVRGWLSEQGRLTLASADPAHLRQVVSLAWIGLCECIGPVAADAALDRAVRAMDAEEAHLHEALRRLL